MFRATGPGLIEVFDDFTGAGSLHALLYNFDFDDFSDYKYREIKPEHAKFLVDKVLPLLQTRAGHIWLRGSASSIGANDWNMTLSRSRSGRVVDFLSRHGVAGDQMQPHASGENLANRHVKDDQRDRSVEIWVLPREKYDPPPPRPVPKNPFVSRKFKIAMVTGLSATQLLNAGRVLKKFKNVKIGGGISIEGIFFMIWDTDNNISCLYFYFGLGPGLGVSFTPKVAATTFGPWTVFTTEKPMSCWQFGRWARFTTIGVGSKSLSWITMETPKGIDNVSSLRIATGTTLGGGGSATIGDIIRVDQPRRFSG